MTTKLIKPMDPEMFKKLIEIITHENTGLAVNRFPILRESKGNFSPEQLCSILPHFKSPSDRIRVVQLLSQRMCPMPAVNVLDIFECISFFSDRLVVLELLKRHIIDPSSPESIEIILSGFISDTDKYRALEILDLKRFSLEHQYPAGGHLFYGIVGMNYKSAYPLKQSLYGPIPMQMAQLPGQGEALIPKMAQTGKPASVYTSHPSYAYNPCQSYASHNKLAD